ncbi:tetratricopeptide repeat protein [Nannocystis bainbridge]|uniref:Tetratricopeptide repeat protein n=1 Tax=Nannocystis bainbridge TaxID=2995303 RepID=A0ABT5DYF1_9BACT|nr:tetratricopeptide repeat protein [Nannocystis bainbridge]MDC0718643.1 tetratricopeptide repeat protein [Nannocystis bainbridge]
MADSPALPPNSPACRKCAFVFEAGLPFERCPNCGTPTQAPPEEPGRVILPRLTTLPLPGTPLGSIRKPQAPVTGFFVPPTLVGDRPGSERNSDAPGAASSRPPSQPSPESSSGEDDLPAPVSTTRPFTLPKITTPPRTLPTTIDSRDLENSAELDLPHLSEMSTVTARVLSRSDDVEVDLADIKAETRELPTQPDAPPPPPRPQLQSRRPTVVLTPPPPEPGALAYAGLIGLFVALVGSFGFYYGRAQETSLVVGAYAAKVPADATARRERDERLAALFDDDTMDSYLTAMAVAEQTEDPLGRAEAALRIHLRYGPDPVRAAQAKTWLTATVQRENFRAERIQALAALADGERATARGMLASGAEPGVTLYRGLLALAAGDFKTAAEDAAEAMSLRPGDQAARWLSFATDLAKDRRASLEPLRDATDRQHRPALELLLVDALIARGRLAEARKRLEALVREPGVSDRHQAHVLVRHARVAAASVEVSRSVYWADEAIKLAPRDPEVVHASLRVLIEADELARAQQGLTARLRDAPDDLEASILQAELALRASNEGGALKAIEKLAAEKSTLIESMFLRGRLALLRGDVEEAVEHFQAAAASKPAHVRAAVEYARLRPCEEALGRLERLYSEHSRDPTESARADLRALALARAGALATLGNRDAAMETLDRALALDPDDNAAQLRRGVLVLETPRSDAGRVDLLAVHERTGGFAGLIGPLSRLYLRSGELRALEALVQPHLSDVRAPDEVVLAIARLRLAQDAVEAAESLADQILLRSPDSWEGHLLKSKVLLARGEPGLAQAELRLSRPGGPNPDVELMAGKIAERSGRLQDALPAFRRAHQLAPTLHEAGFLYGRALLQLGRAQEAVTELSAVTRATEAFPAAFMALGQAHYERENFEEARRQLQRAVTLEPGLTEAHYWLGRSEHDLQLDAEAAVSLGRAVQAAAPGTAWLPDAHLWLARAAEAHGDVATSRTAYEEFLRLAPATAPGRREAERALARVARAP